MNLKDYPDIDLICTNCKNKWNGEKFCPNCGNEMTPPTKEYMEAAQKYENSGWKKVGEGLENIGKAGVNAGDSMQKNGCAMTFGCLLSVIVIILLLILLF